MCNRYHDYPNQFLSWNSLRNLTLAINTSPGESIPNPNLTLFCGVKNLPPPIGSISKALIKAAVPITISYSANPLPGHFRQHQSPEDKIPNDLPRRRG